MRRMRGKLAAWGLLAAVGACDSTAPVEPETLAIEAGDNQNGSTGSALPEMLSVRVTGSDGMPFAGAAVRWQVVSGAAQVSPQTSSTNAEGIATTTVTLGSSPGAVVVSATVDGLPVVSFNANATSACDAIEPHTIGSTVDGTLTTDSCQLSDNTRADRFSFNLTAAQSIRFIQSAVAMNPFLSLEDENGNAIAFHDDISNSDRTARMRVFLPPGSYVVTPSGSAPADLGAYTFSSELATDAVGSCGATGQDPVIQSFFENWVTRGVQLTQELAATDCVLGDQDGNRYYVHLYFIFLRQGETLRITQSSTELDSYVELYRVTASGIDFIDFNDDENSSTDNSALTHEVLLNGVYLILPSTSVAQEVGAYTLGVN